MTPTRASITAEAVCFWRALEASRPPALRALDDPHAHRFLSPLPASWLRLSRLTGGRILSSVDDAVFGGTMNFSTLRHRWMDERFCHFAAEAPPEQILILGAGYDMRAWRLPLGGAALFEIDHPATSGRKQAVLRRHGIASPPDRRVITVDFATEDFSQKLLDSGFDPAKRSWAFWEGVSMYLPAAAVRQTLSALRRLRCAATVDFFQPAPDAGSYNRYLNALPVIVSAVQEPLDFQLPVGDAPAFFADLGLRLTAQAVHTDLMQLCPGRRSNPCAWVAEIAPAGSA